MYRIEYANKTVFNNLKDLRANERKRILDSIDKQLRREPTVKTKHRKPIVSVEGMDEEQLQLGSSDKFWKLVEKWRKEKTISRAELERRLNNKNGSRGRKQKKSSV
jgi:hypothetical protein